MYKRILNNLIEAFNINKGNGEDLAFELLGASIAFDKSPFYIRENCWNVKTNRNNQIVTNNQDGKIDAFDVDANEEKITIKLLQSKHSERIKANDMQLFFTSIEKYILNNEEALPSTYEDLENVRIMIKDAKNKYSNASISYEVYITALYFNDQIKQSINSLFKSHLSNVEAVGPIYIDKEKIESGIVKIKENIIKEEFNNNKVSITFQNNVNSINTKGYEILVDTIKANQVINLINTEFKNNYELSRLFSGNVRGFLDEKTAVNKDIVRTIVSSPNKFLSMNNGAVIICEEIEQRGSSKEYLLTNPIIVNGQQTFALIYKHLDKSKNIEDLSLPVKVIKVSSEKYLDSLREISKSSNQSNQIDNLDLLSNTPLVKYLKMHFANKGLYLKVKKGEILNDVFFKDEEKVDLTELIKLWVAIYLERPNQAKTTSANIAIFSDAYKGKKTKHLLAMEENFDKIAEMFYDCYEMSRLEIELQNKFSTETYYSHASYFIIYLLRQKYRDDYKNLNIINFDEIKQIAESGIEKERDRQDLLYTHNNYFKSARPITDYTDKETIRTNDAIEKLFSS